MAELYVKFAKEPKDKSVYLCCNTAQEIPSSNTFGIPTGSLGEVPADTLSSYSITKLLHFVVVMENGLADD